MFNWLFRHRHTSPTERFGLQFVEVPPGQILYHGREFSITRPFLIAKTLVTFENLLQFASVAGIAPDAVIEKLYPDESGHHTFQYYKASPNMPIHSHCFRFATAINFVKTLTAFEAAHNRLPAGFVYRLPTEIEYAYAAAGPQGLLYPWGNTWDDAKLVGWNADSWALGSITESASWCGAFDMLSCAQTWCLDHYYPMSEREHGYYDPIRRMWDTTRRQDSLAVNANGWSYSPVVKGGVFRLSSGRVGDNNSRNFRLQEDADYMALRIVCGQDKFNVVCSER